MNVVLVDTRQWPETHRYSDDYISTTNILKTFTYPIYMIRWINNCVELERWSKYSEPHFRSDETIPHDFMKLLYELHGPIHLHLFSSVPFNDQHVKICHPLCNQRFLFSRVSLFLSRDACKEDVLFLHCFPGAPVDIYHDRIYKGTASPHIDWDKFLQLNVILKDYSFKASVLAQLSTEKRDCLKQRVRAHRLKILRKHFFNNSAANIETFYATRDVEGCAQYVRSYPSSTILFRVHQLFLDTLQQLDNPRCLSFEKRPLRNVPAFVQERIEKAYVGDYINRLPIHPVRWLGVPENPFCALEMDLTEILEAVGGAVSNQPLSDTYLFNNRRVDPADLILHNSSVLSKLLHHNLPGCPVLWQMVFLYVLAEQKYPTSREFFYREIRFLGEQGEFYLPLKPHFPVVASLNACFWYSACVAPVAFTNDKRNVLRSVPFNAQLFLEFYRQVYDPEYRDPPKVPLWRCWRTLRLDPTSILPILSHYFDFERLEVEKGEGANPFMYVLCRREAVKGERVRREPEAAFSYLRLLTLEKVLSVYGEFLKRQRNGEKCSAYQEIEYGEPVALKRAYVPEGRETLNHVKIHLRTCRPLMRCPESGMDWRTCAGNFDVKSESYVQLFREYCLAHGRYPTDWKDLLLFLNETLFRRKEKLVPAMFPRRIKEYLEMVMTLFADVMRTYACTTKYLERARFFACEKRRAKMEEMSGPDEPPEARDLDETYWSELFQLLSKPRIFNCWF